MATDISLTAAMRSNLVSLQQTANNIESVQNRLATGKKVATALDNPTNYFIAADHTKRADDFTTRKDGMLEAIQAIKAADNGITGIKTLLQAASGLVESARSGTATDRSALATQFSTVLTQITTLVSDSKYKGTNFLTHGSLTVAFNADATASLTVQGFSSDASSLGVTIATANFSLDTSLDAAASQITVALSTLATESSKLASNLAVVNTRLDFTKGLVNNEKAGADNLTLADMNEESANMLALQTRQNLGITSLNLASQANSSILRLF